MYYFLSLLSFFLLADTSFAAVREIYIPEDVEIIPNQYIITTKRSRGLLNLHLEDITRLTRRINILQSIIGMGTYIAHVHPNEISWLMRRPEVAAIEADHLVFLNEVQEPAPWGISRLTSEEPISSSNSRYLYNPNGGEGVSVYILDSGIDTSHSELEGRARWGKSFIKGVNKDDNGHGTHVAGIIGSNQFGVAKAVNLIAVKVFAANGVTSNSKIIAGIDWILKDSKNNKKSIINMSFGSALSYALNRATEAAVARGIVVAAAAGNQNKDACFTSPASAKNVITVGATTIEESRASYSNYGFCVDVFAPGSRILSTWLGGRTKTLSGTSMASPHVAGLAAIFRSLENLSPAQTKAKILGLSQKAGLKNLRLGSPDKLVHTDGR